MQERLNGKIRRCRVDHTGAVQPRYCSIVKFESSASRTADGPADSIAPHILIEALNAEHVDILAVDQRYPF